MIKVATIQKLCAQVLQSAPIQNKSFFKGANFLIVLIRSKIFNDAVKIKDVVFMKASALKSATTPEQALFA